MGHGRLGSPDRTRRAPCRGRWHRRCARASRGDARRDRRPRLHRLALHSRGRRTRRRGGCPRSERGPHGLDPDHRRYRPRGGRLQGPRPSSLRGRCRNPHQTVPGRLLPAPERPHNRPAQSIDGPEDLPKRSPARVRSKRLRERLLEDLLFFLERPSVTGSEKRLCDDLAKIISSSPDWEIERVSNNLAIRRKEPDPSLPRVVLAGHLDTVPEPEGGIEVRVEGDRVYGRGASDMKSGDAVMLALLEHFARDLAAETRFEPIFVFYEQEEGHYADNGLEAVFAGSSWVLDAELALVPEPTAAALEVGCVGTAHVEVTFSGTSAHAARPWQGENALTRAGEFLTEL